MTILTALNNKASLLILSIVVIGQACTIVSLISLNNRIGTDVDRKAGITRPTGIYKTIYTTANAGSICADYPDYSSDLEDINWKLDSIKDYVSDFNIQGVYCK